MANLEHLALLKQDLKEWNALRRNKSFKVDLSGANLCGVDLRGANLSEADLSETNLRGVYLFEANLVGATLIGADLRRACLSGANLGADISSEISGPDFTGADLTEAEFVGTYVHGAFLEGANFEGALFASTVLADVDLRSVRGLESIRHVAPSTIGLDTLIRSEGNIPEVFLQGAGIPEPFITNMKSLISAMDPIQFYSLFISYSTEDQIFAERLHTDLQIKGIRCWFAPHDVKGGRKLHEQIDEAIRNYDKLLLILSPASMASEWVKTEISKARKRELREGARVLFPISLAPFEAIRDWECFDSDAGKDSAREIREYFIPDFSNWKKSASYQKAFNRLMKDLQTPTQAASA